MRKLCLSPGIRASMRRESNISPAGQKSRTENTMQPRRTIARLSAVLCLFAVHLRAQDLATTAAIYRPKLGKNLKDNIAGFWYPKTVDRKNGGYILNHDSEGRLKGEGTKMIV